MQFQPVVLAAIQRDGKFLLTLRNHSEDPTSPFHNKWQLPGGKLEFGESPEGALTREIKEELGTDIRIQKLLPKIYHRIRGEVQFIFFVFICQIDSHATVVLNEEASKYDWFTLEQTQKLEFLPLTDEVLRSASVSL